MVKIRVIKREEKGYVELPPDLAMNDEVELFQLKDGFYLITIPLAASTPKQPVKNQITETEKAVLRKLLSIRFENRVPAYVNKTLSEQEKTVLKELEGRGLVNVYKGKKYVDGVYNVSDSIYVLLAQKNEPEKSNNTAVSKPVQQQAQANSLGVLNSRGYIIITDKREAMTLSEQLNAQMRSGAVVGVKGFDNKFYVVTKDYFLSSQAKIAAILKEDMDSSSVANATKLESEGCIAVLRLMAENGDIIEKKKGVFAPV